LNRNDKSAVIERLRAELEDVPAVIVADFKGLNVEQTTQLRVEFRKADVRYEVVKNTLARAAVAGTPKESLAKLFKGNSAIAYHKEDATAPAKVLTDFLKDSDKITVKGAWLNGDLLDDKGVTALAKLPGRDELRGKFLSVLNGVPTKFVRTLIAGPQSFVRVLQARAQQIEAN
jgi:large subunit ribosomal protein L10